MKPTIIKPDYLVKLAQGLYGIPLSEYVSVCGKALLSNYYVDITINHVFKYDKGIITKCEVIQYYPNGEKYHKVGQFMLADNTIRESIGTDDIPISIRYVVDDEFDSIKLSNGAEVIPIEYRMDDKIVYVDSDLNFWQEYLKINVDTIVPTIELVTKQVVVPDNIVKQTKLEFELNDTRKLRFKLIRLSHYMTLPMKAQQSIYVDRLGNLYVKHLGGYTQVIPDSNDVYYVGIGSWIPRNHIIKALNGWTLSHIKQQHSEFCVFYSGCITNAWVEILITHKE